MILKVYYKKFYEQQYIKFGKLNQHIRQILKQTLIAKEIYIGKSSGYINQVLAKLIINNQFLPWDPNNLYNYKKVYLILKIWLFFDFNSIIP